MLGKQSGGVFRCRFVRRGENDPLGGCHVGIQIFKQKFRALTVSHGMLTAKAVKPGKAFAGKPLGNGIHMQCHRAGQEAIQLAFRQAVFGVFGGNAALGEQQFNLLIPVPDRGLQAVADGVGAPQ